MAKPTFWLRCETKPFERRAALTPTTSKRLIDAGFEIFVERDEQRIFDDSEYEAVGCKLVENNSWPTAPKTVTIIGLKELEESTEPLPHTHIQFAHCYKNQAGWSAVLSRFHRGGGTLYDLEFLNDASGRRVAAFGFHAGFAGAAAGALALSSQKKGEKLGHLQPFENENAMVANVKQLLGGSGKGVKALVIGALGRCGRGAVDLFRKIGLAEWVHDPSFATAAEKLIPYRDDILKWDLDETAKGGPFEEILDVDIFVNCIYLNSQIPSFITRDQIIAAGPKRKLSVVVDVSCDTTNPFNPIPIYSINTTFAEPTVAVDVGALPALSVISIDHLPTLLPREASEQFSLDLLPSLLEFPNRQTARVWTDAEKLFIEKRDAAAKAEGLV
ncbi:Saccharopine dehydrogenase [NAD(+), L-lysine-forming] [Mycena sanguinolenta]|uniref:Saccharopine dehydrogenase [NAD(+), L-lysine-forming] n=1 Tax=Mycena sanguinolenta TaxID=230812 RepID=A0A8H6XFR0_9AGAR|nr:Saccharopine dehydrogenase [NAD(+), L-lysine-forming] [Mycena sanguinolenta]